MGGDTSLGGSEVVVIMQKGQESASGSYQYRLLATNRTSTMQKEMNQAAGEGFRYAGQTVFETAFGGKETVVIMERDATAGAGQAKYEYKLLATKKTSTMQKELALEGENGFQLAGPAAEGSCRAGAGLSGEGGAGRAHHAGAGRAAEDGTYPASAVRLGGGGWGAERGDLLSRLCGIRRERLAGAPA